MSDKPNEEFAIDSTAHDELDLDPPDDYGVGDVAGSVTLTQHLLGLEPYVLIRAVKVDPEDEGDDGLRLKVEHNDSGVALAAMYVLNLPAESNPITAAIKAVIDANGEFPEVAEVLGLFAEFCDVPMPESGSRC